MLSRCCQNFALVQETRQKFREVLKAIQKLRNCFEVFPGVQHVSSLKREGFKKSENLAKTEKNRWRLYHKCSMLHDIMPNDQNGHTAFRPK